MGAHGFKFLIVILLIERSGLCLVYLLFGEIVLIGPAALSCKPRIVSDWSIGVIREIIVKIILIIFKTHLLLTLFIILFFMLDLLQ